MKGETMKRHERLYAELESIRETHGKLLPSAVVEYARRHPKSQCHADMTWDDGIAAERWRLREAQQIIKAVYEPGPTSAPLRIHAYYSPPSYRNGEDGYVTAQQVRSSADIAREIARDAMKRIEAAFADLTLARDALPELAKVTRSCGRLIEQLRLIAEPGDDDMREAAE